MTKATVRRPAAASAFLVESARRTNVVDDRLPVVIVLLPRAGPTGFYSRHDSTAI
jgi:hypothetical protein